MTNQNTCNFYFREERIEFQTLANRNDSLSDDRRASVPEVTEILFGSVRINQLDFSLCFWSV